ncbi:hypothetical protein A4S06_11425 [Erysipelotrichaceae bacterium MTC7]|nr:hypothetical protein A4S06_11425 [Erysipelotrichaceae bacterium MTC7]
MKRIIVPIIQVFIEISVFMITSNTLRLNAGFEYQLLIIYVLFNFVFGHYNPKSELIWIEFRRQIQSILAFVFVAIVFIPNKNINRISSVVFLGMIMFFISILVNRTTRIMFRNRISYKTAIIGTNYDAYRIGQISKNNRFAMIKTNCYFSIDGVAELENLNDGVYPLIEEPVYSYDQMVEILVQNQIDHVIVVLPKAERKQLNKILDEIIGIVPNIQYMPSTNNLMTFASTIADYDGVFLIL